MSPAALATRLRELATEIGDDPWVRTPMVRLVLEALADEVDGDGDGDGESR